MKATDASVAIVKEIVIKAPAERIFKALTDPRQRVKWWGAAGRFQATHMESDLRPGGAWLMRGTGVGGKPFTIRGEYTSVEPRRLVESTWVEDWRENESPTIVRFELQEQGESTLVRLIHSDYISGEHRDGYQGWSWLLSLLDNYVRNQSTN